MPKPVIVYVYANCSTCRAAIGWLRECGIPFEERPIYERPPGVSELKRMLEFKGGQLRKLFNTSGLEYRALDLKSKLPKMSQDEALALLARNGRLVKRPFLLTDAFGFVGFNPETWGAAFRKLPISDP